MIDAQERTASVHREPAAGYRDMADLPREVIMQPRADGLAAFSVALADLD